jgi:hypothetical protein
MELSWLMKLRIAIAAAIGVALVGYVAWPWDNPPDPYGSILVKAIGMSSIVTLFVMAFLAGLIAYFAAWPYGKEIGILAVPFGLAVWAIRAGTVGGLMQLNSTVEQRQIIFSTLRWEPFLWLLVVGAGFGGVALGRKIRTSAKRQESSEKKNLKSSEFFNIVLAFLLSCIIAYVGIRVLAQDIRIYDNRASVVTAQPAVGQVAFAVFISFGLAAFVVKKFLDISYIWPIMASAVITAFSIIVYLRQESFEYLVERWPAIFFSDVVIVVLPVQMVTFGVLGSVAGYWMAVRYNYWRKHEMK